MDDPLDRLNRGMLQKVLEVSDDKRMLEWGIRMYVVSRQIERIGDNGTVALSRNAPRTLSEVEETFGRRAPRRSQNAQLCLRSPRLSG